MSCVGTCDHCIMIGIRSASPINYYSKITTKSWIGEGKMCVTYCVTQRY